MTYTWSSSDEDHWSTALRPIGEFHATHRKLVVNAIIISQVRVVNRAGDPDLLSSIIFELYYVLANPKNTKSMNPDEFKSFPPQNETPASSPNPGVTNTVQLSPLTPQPPSANQFQMASPSAPPGSEKPRKKWAMPLAFAVIVVAAAGIATWLILAKSNQTTSKTGSSAASSKTFGKTNTQASVRPSQSELASIDTSNWHTASNPALHYSFKYPNDDDMRLWRHYDSTVAGTTNTGVEAGLVKLHNNNLETAFGLVITPIGSSDDIYTTPQTTDATKFPAGTTLVKQDDIIKNGVTGTCYMMQYKDFPAQDLLNCRFEYEGNAYIISISDYGNGPSDEFNNSGKYPVGFSAEKMLDTFQFL